MKHIIISWFFCIISIGLQANPVCFEGKIINAKNEALEVITVRLLETDSIVVSETITNNKGEFKICTAREGDYLLCLSAVGYSKNIRFCQYERKQAEKYCVARKNGGTKRNIYYSEPCYT